MQEGHTNVYTAFHSYNPRAKTHVVISCSLTWFFTYKVSAAVHSSHVAPTSMSRFEGLSWQLLVGCEFPRDSRSSIHAPLSPTHCHSLVLCPRVFLKGPQLQKGPQLHNSRKAHNSLRSVIFPACLDEDYVFISPGSSFCFIWRLLVSQVPVLCRMFQNETVDSKHGSAINDPSGSCWRHPTRPPYVTLVCPVFRVSYSRLAVTKKHSSPLPSFGFLGGRVCHGGLLFNWIIEWSSRGIMESTIVICRL